MIPEAIRKVHFIGVAGSGMSAISWALLQRGYSVSGSDLGTNSQTRRLQEAGARIFLGHAAEHVAGADLVVASTAIPTGNVERLAAEGAGIPIWQRGRMLAEIMDSGTSIAVAGAHGKTTTTSMLGLLLTRAGLDPTVLVGGELFDFGGNARVGNGRLIVAEADESDGSFLLMQPDVAVVTNVDADHLDHWKTWEALQEGYVDFLQRIKQEGRAVICTDGPAAREAAHRSGRPVASCSVEGQDAEWQARGIHVSSSGSRFECWRAGLRLGEARLRLPGRHMVADALLAIAAATEQGVEFETASVILSDYPGVSRRWQSLGEEAGVRVMDDYGHHPTEIQATLQAAREAMGQGAGRLVVVFQPHRFSRTLHFSEAFGPSFAPADLVVITDIYPAGERPIEGVSGRLIFNSAQRQSRTESFYVPQLEDVPDFLLDRVASGDTVVTMGAGDVSRVGGLVLEGLRERTAAGQ